MCAPQDRANLNRLAPIERVCLGRSDQVARLAPRIVEVINNNDVRSRHGRHVNLCDVCPVYARPSDMHSVG